MCAYGLRPLFSAVSRDRHSSLDDIIVPIPVPVTPNPITWVAFPFRIGLLLKFICRQPTRCIDTFL